MTLAPFPAMAQGPAIARLLAAGSGDRLRAALRDRNPDFDPRDLKQIAIVGAAAEGRRLARLCAAHGIAIAAAGDDHPAMAGTALGNATIAPVAELGALDRKIPVVIASHRLLGATERLRALGFRSVLPFAALQVLAPELFPPHMFYDGLLEDLWANRARYAGLREELADERSRQVLDAVIGFRETLDPLMLKPVLEENLYAPAGLFELSDHEVYVDAGSFDGDTIRTFIARAHNRFDRVYGFEPDPSTYVKLTASFAHEPRVHAIHAGLHRQKAVLRFRDDATRGAIFAEDGDIEMSVTTLDDVLDGGRVTFVKMNIEGAEIDALAGGANAIRRWRPKLAISVYHRPSDLWQIPQVVRDLREDYDFYLRQHDGGIIETVLYALPRGGNGSAGTGA